MPRKTASLRHRQRGSVAVLVGLTIFVLVGMIGLALDLGQMFVNKTELQNAADACALAAARELDGNADALARADAAGALVGNQNWAGFQNVSVTLTAADISYSEYLSPNSDYLTNSAGADPATAKYAMCKVERTDIGVWFMSIRGFGDQTVSAYAVATLAPSQTTCAVPIGMCKQAGSSAPSFGLVEGQWYSGKFSAGTSGTTGSYNWIDFDPSGGGANEIRDLLSGPGQCDLPAIGAQVGQQGQISSATDAWNTRFGLYKGSYSITSSPPDYTGIAYTRVGIGSASETTWPNPAPENAYSGTPTSGTTANYQAARIANTSYQSSNPSGINGINAFSIATPAQLAQYGSLRRVALAPIVDCLALAGTNPQTVTLEGYACVLLLNPIKGPDDVVMEYLGQPNDPDSPCSSFGLGGGTSGPLVPVLVQ